MTTKAQIELDADEIMVLLIGIRGVLDVGERVSRQLEEIIQGLTPLGPILEASARMIENIETTIREAHERASTQHIDDDGEIEKKDES